MKIPFANIKIEWSFTTFLFYIAIVLGSYMIVRVFKDKEISWGQRKRHSLRVGLFLVLLILGLVKCFSTTGRDLRSGYYINFLSATSMSNYRDQTVEPGFRLLMVLVRKITDNYAVFLFVLGLLTIIPVVFFINKYRKRIDVAAAVLLYTSIYFFPGFSVYRLLLAASISLFAFDAVAEKKFYKAIIWTAIASTIHISSIVMIVPILLVFMRFLSKRMIAVCALLVFVMVVFGKERIGAIIASYDRYSIYSVNQGIRIGFEQIAYYAPFFLLVYRIRKRKENEHWFRMAYVYTITGFLLGTIGYIVPIFGRMQSLFLPFIILIPYCLDVYKKKLTRRNRVLIDLLVVLYCVARFVIWIVQYYNLDDLMPYTSVFGTVG